MCILFVIRVSFRTWTSTNPRKRNKNILRSSSIQPELVSQHDLCRVIGIGWLRQWAARTADARSEAAGIYRYRLSYRKSPRPRVNRLYLPRFWPYGLVVLVESCEGTRQLAIDMADVLPPAPRRRSRVAWPFARYGGMVSGRRAAENGRRPRHKHMRKAWRRRPRALPFARTGVRLAETARPLTPIATRENNSGGIMYLPNTGTGWGDRREGTGERLAQLRSQTLVYSG